MALALATISTPRSGSGASLRPSSRWWSTSSKAWIDSCTTGMEASGKACTSTDRVPWSMPQLSTSAPTQVGCTTSLTSDGAWPRHRLAEGRGRFPSTRGCVGRQAADVPGRRRTPGWGRQAPATAATRSAITAAAAPGRVAAGLWPHGHSTERVARAAMARCRSGCTTSSAAQTT